MKVGDLVRVKLRSPYQLGFVIKRKSMSIGFPKLNHVRGFDGRLGLHPDDHLEMVSEHEDATR